MFQKERYPSNWKEISLRIRDHYLGENRGNFWCNRDELIDEVKRSQPQLVREVQAA